MQDVKAPFLTALSTLLRPEPYMINLWIWENRHHWLMNPSQFKLSVLDGLINGPPWADYQIRTRIGRGYLDNEEALFSVPKFKNLVLYLIEHKYLSSEKALGKSLEYSNYQLVKDILRAFPKTKVQSCVIYAYENFLWDIIDHLLDHYDLSNKDLEFLLSENAYDGLVHYLIVTEKVAVTFDTMQLAAKCGNMYVFMKMTEISTDVVPNYDTLILAAGSGNMDLVKYLVERYNIEPEELAFKNAANYEIVRYFLDTRQVPLYEGVFQTICERGILKSVKFLLQEHSIIPDFDICTISARSGNVDLLRYLISYGFQVGISTLVEAAENGHLDLFKYLSLEKKIQIPDQILVISCRSGKVDIMRYLVEDLKYTPNTECVEAVSESGSMDGFLYLMNLPDTSFTLNDTISACMGGNVVILNYLVEKFDLQPDIHSLNEALKRGNRDIFLYIHKFHSHIFLDATSETLIAAIEGKQLDFIEYLLPQYRIHKDEFGLMSLLFNQINPMQKEIMLGVEDLLGDEADDESSQLSRPGQVDPLFLKRVLYSLSEASVKITDDYTHNQGIKKISRIFNRLKEFNEGPEPFLDVDIVFDKFATYHHSDLEDIEEDQDFFTETDQILDNPVMTERDPLIIDEQIMVKVFINGTPEILDYFIQTQDSWTQYKDLPYLMGNLPLVKYLNENLKMDPTSYHLKLAAASGNIELLKYLSSEKSLILLDDTLDFACILGKINPILFYAKQKSFTVDNLILDLAHESKNLKLQKLLRSFNTKTLSFVEYLFRKREVNAFKKLYKDLM